MSIRLAKKLRLYSATPPELCSDIIERGVMVTGRESAHPRIDQVCFIAASSSDDARTAVKVLRLEQESY